MSMQIYLKCIQPLLNTALKETMELQFNFKPQSTIIYTFADYFPCFS